MKGWSWDDLLAHRSQMIEWGEIPPLEVLLARCLAAPTDDQLWQLVADDVRLRRAAGESLDQTDYERRFPNLSARLAAQFSSEPSDRPTDELSAKTLTGVSDRESDSKPPSSESASGGSSTSGLSLPGKLKKFAPGTMFGSYLIEEILGHGGMGVVYKAKHRMMGRRVALKVVAEQSGVNDLLLKRFRREASVVSRLNHPNIVAAYDADDVDGVLYLTLEFVAGPDLSNLVKSDGPLPIATAIDYIIQAARGLGHAHQQGVVHRDIKPSNLMLDTACGVVKVLDLGLARVEALLDEASRPTELTSTGVMFGTVDYLAPEQARDAKRADARSDIYSLGCTLYFLLTGETLFRGETILQKIRQHQEAPIPCIAAARAGVPNRLEVVLSRMLAKQPDDRFQTMGEVATALDECLATLQGTLADTEQVIEATVIHRPADESTRTITQRVSATPRQRRGWWLGGSVLIAMALSFIAWLAFRPKAPSEKIDLTDTGTVPSSEKTTDDATNETTTTDVEPVQPLEWKKPDGLQTVLAPQLVERDTPLSARATVQNPPRLPGVRSWTVELAGARSSISRVEYSEAALLYAVCTNGGPHIQIYDDQLKLVKLLVGGHGNASNGSSPTLAWSPDGSLLATVDWSDYRGTGLRIWDVKSGTVLLHRPRLAAWSPSVAWSPDGRLLAVGGHSVELLDIHSGLSRSLKTNNGNRVAWSPDSQRVAVSDNSSHVSIYSAADLQVVQAITAEKADVRPPFVWSPDGRQFLTGSTKSGEAHLFDGESFAFQKSLKLNQQPAEFLWTNDPHRVVVAGQKTIVWNLKDDQLTTTIGAGGAVSWVKPNESLVIGRSDGVLEVRSIAGLPMARSQDRGQPRAELAALSHDGRELAIARNTDLQFFDAESGTPKESLKNVIANGAKILWSPSGERMAAVSDKEVAVLDRKSGKGILTLAGHTDTILSLRWSPDATQIVTTSKDKTLRVWDVMATVETTQQTLNEPVLEATWSHSGKMLAAALKRELLLLSADGKQIVSRHALPADFAAVPIGLKSLCWSADDALLTCSNNSNPQYVFDVARGSIEPFHRQNLGFSLRGPFDWSPDGRQLVGQGDYNESYVIDRGTQALRRIGYTFHRQFLPDSRRLLSHGFGILELWGIDTQTGRVIGTMYPSLSTSTEPVVISSDGHVRGPSRSVLYVAQTDSGSLLTLTASEFEKRFGWKNDPNKAALLRLPDSAPSPPNNATPQADPNDNDFATLGDPQWKSVELPVEDAQPSQRLRSGSALVPRPATINGLRWWTVETEGHRGAVDVLAFSPTGQLIASAGEDGTIRLWDERGRLRRVLTDAFANATWLDWSRDGSYLASAHGAQVRLWDVTNGRRLRAVTLPANGLTLSWSADASRLAVGMENNRWGVIDARTEQLTEIAVAGERVAWSPDGTHIATGQGFNITIREAERLIPVRTLIVSSDVTGLGSLSWSPDGSVLVAGFGSNQSRVGVWKALTGEWLGDLEPRTGPTTQFSWSRDGQRVSNGFHVWDVSTRQAIASCPLPEKRSVLSPNGSLIAGLNGTRLSLRDVSTGQVIADGPEGIASVPKGRLTIGGQSLVLLDGYGIGRLDSTSGIARDELIFYNQSWQAIAPDYFGDVFAVKSEGTLSLLNRDRRPAKPLNGHTDYINELAWSADGKLFATTSRDGTLRVWNLEQDQPLHTFDHQKKSVTGLAWSADSERIATIASTDQPLRVWNLKTGKADVEVGKIPGVDQGGNLAWQADGKSLLIGRNTLPPLSIDLATGTIRDRNARSGRITVSPNGQFIAMNSGVESTGSSDIESFPGEVTDRRTVGEWFPDSKRLTVTAAGALRVYSAEHHRYLGALLTSLPRGNRLIVGPNGHWRSFPAERVGLVYVAEADAGQFELFSPEEFEKRFGWKNQPEQATLSDLSVEPAPESVSPQPRYEDDRAAALATLGKQGRVRIRLHGAERDVSSVELLPFTPFEVIGVYFQGRPITNDDLSYLRPLKSLRELSLWSCSKITDGVLETIGDHPHLRRLEVHFTSLTDNGLMALPRFPQLEQLQLDGLPVSDAIAPALTQLHRLTSLTMNGPQLGDATIHALVELPYLSSLNLKCPKATVAAAADLAKMRSLRNFDFRTPVAAEALKALSELPQLSSLLLYEDKPTDSGDVEVGPFPAIRTLLLVGTMFNDSALRRLGESPALDSVDLQQTKLTDASLVTLLQSKSLRNLSINHAPLLSAKAFPSLADSRLVGLTMRGVAIDDDSVRHILEAPALKSLAFTGASFTGAAFDGFDNLPLETLRIHGAPIAAEHAPAFAKLKNLRTMIADETIFTALASGLAQLPSLRSLECAQAKSLVGVGQIKQAQTLYLHTAGALPAAEYQHLAGMDRLESLQVHAANFTQEHFDQLRKLTGPRKLILQDGTVTQPALDKFKAESTNWTVTLNGCKVIP